MSESQQCFNLFSQYTGADRMEIDLSDIPISINKFPLLSPHVCYKITQDAVVCLFVEYCDSVLMGMGMGGQTIHTSQNTQKHWYRGTAQ